jgi:hypothetical protein
MKRLMVVSLVGVTALLLGLAPNASAGSRTFYFGHTEPKQSLLFDVVQTSQGRVFEPQFINFVVTCPVTGDVIEAEFGFSGFQIPIQHNRFSLNLSDIFTKFVWAGKVGTSRATGTLVAGFPAYDEQGGLQDCNAGSLTWHAKAFVSPRAAPQTTETGSTMVFQVTKTSSGHVQISVQR